MPVINCIGLDNIESQFSYDYSTDNINGYTVYTFFIKPIVEPAQDNYEISVTVINQDFVKITMMNRHDQEIYRGKGIAFSMIPEIQRVLNKRVISSSRDKRFKLLSEEDRNPTATRVWDRLVAVNRAIYLSCYDVYLFLPNGY